MNANPLHSLEDALHSFAAITSKIEHAADGIGCNTTTLYAGIAVAVVLYLLRK